MELREEMTEQLAMWGLIRNAEYSAFTVGAAQGLDFAIKAAKRHLREIGAGETNVIFPIPGFTPTRKCAIDDLSPSRITSQQCTGDEFNLTVTDIEEAFRANSKQNLLILTPISNPMGTIADPELLIPAVEKFIELSPNGVIILDWAYLMLSKPENEKVAQLLEFFSTQGIRNRCIEVVSFSKATGDPGRRECIVYAPSSNNDPVEESVKSLWTHLNGVMSCNNPSAIRATMIEALAYAKEVPVSVMIEFGKLIQMRTNYLAEVLKESGLFSNIISPEGTLYVMARLNQQGVITNPRDLFIQKGIAGVDGKAFGTEDSGWVRFSVGLSTMDDIRKLATLLSLE